MWRSSSALTSSVALGQHMKEALLPCLQDLDLFSGSVDQEVTSATLLKHQHLLKVLIAADPRGGHFLQDDVSDAIGAVGAL